jgi:hypothetical protein
MDTRKQLADFYRQVQQRAPENYQSFSDLVGPDLIWVDDEYLNAKTRIAIIGQQIDGWDYTYPEFIDDWKVDDAIEGYRKFDYGISYYSSPFWQFFHQVRQLQHGPNAGQRMVLWTNLLKFVAADQNRILWKPYKDSAIALQEDILVTELRITTPDVCIFVTGPDYDEILEQYYPGIQFQALTAPVRVFAKLKHKDLPKRSYRCYHPKYLRIGGHWEETIDTLGKELGWKTQE